MLKWKQYLNYWILRVTSPADIEWINLFELVKQCQMKGENLTLDFLTLSLHVFSKVKYKTALRSKPGVCEVEIFQIKNGLFSTAYIFFILWQLLGNGNGLCKYNWQKVLMILNFEEFSVQSSKGRCSTSKYWHMCMNSTWQSGRKVTH